jgi:hypothetical protein
MRKQCLHLFLLMWICAVGVHILVRLFNNIVLADILK